MVILYYLMSLRSVWPPWGKSLYWDPKDSWNDGQGHRFCSLDLQHPGQCLAEAFLNRKINTHKIPFQYWHYTSLADTCGVVSRILLGGNGRQKPSVFYFLLCFKIFPSALFTEHTSMSSPSETGTRNDEELRYCHCFQRATSPKPLVTYYDLDPKQLTM